MPRHELSWSVVSAILIATLSCTSSDSSTAGSSAPLHPRLVAVSVADLDSSIEFYEITLGFEVIGRYEFPEDRMRLAFLERENFEVELIEIADTPGFDAPDPANPATRQGLVKLGFYSSRIDHLYSAIRTTDTVIQSPLRNSNRTGGRFFIVLDPDGNWIQIFGPPEITDP